MLLVFGVSVLFIFNVVVGGSELSDLLEFDRTKTALNVNGGRLQICSTDPLTGYYRY